MSVGCSQRGVLDLAFAKKFLVTGGYRRLPRLTVTGRSGVEHGERLSVGSAFVRFGATMRLRLASTRQAAFAWLRRAEWDTEIVTIVKYYAVLQTKSFLWRNQRNRGNQGKVTKSGSSGCSAQVCSLQVPVEQRQNHGRTES